MGVALTDEMVRCAFVTLGCAKNEVDTDRMRSLLLHAGALETDDVDEADCVIVNTCSFLVAATEESLQVTLEIAESVREGVRRRPIIMCGCVPSRYGDELASELPEVAAFVPADREDEIVEVVERVVGVTLARDLPEVARTVEAAHAFVKISDGCDRFCTFCAIPYIRGAYRSRPAEEILAEVTSLIEGGVREVVLIGQDTGVWGQDLPGSRDLAWLLREVASVAEPYGCWVRVLYLQPEGMTDDLIEVLASGGAVLPYIDIPIQHCSATVLERMGRSGSAEELRELFARLRREIEGVVIRTTAMAGFPGETDEEADELVSFVAEEGFDYTSVFTYSAEEGTVAATMEPQVAEDVALERTQALIDVSEAAGFAATASHVGEEVDVIVDGVEETDDGVELIGHAWFQAPDSDGAVHIEEGEAAVGDIVRVRLTDSFCYELVGVVV